MPHSCPAKVAGSAFGSPSEVEQGAVKPRPKRRSLAKRARATWKELSRYALSRRSWFFRGAVFALLVVAIRVAMPWPLQIVIKPWLQGGELDSQGLLGWHPVLEVGLAYAVLVTLLGFADYRLRLDFARFAISVVRDIREAILSGMAELRRRDPERTPGDLVTRLVGDSARLKAGLKGFLVHVATNGLLFMGISIVLLLIEWRIGLIFLSASVLTVLVTGIGASRIYRRALRYRRKESRIAESISEQVARESAARADDDDEVSEESVEANQVSGKHEAQITKIQGLTTWCAHLILAVAVPAALWVGYQAVVAGTLSASKLFVVMLYTLMILGPMVRLARQGARCGKIMASADRLRVLHRRAIRSSARCGDISGLERAISLRSARVCQDEEEKARRRLGRLTLEFSRGEKVALLGPPGSGKSTLLSLLAGRVPYRGKVQWDGVDSKRVRAESLQAQVAYLSQNSPLGPFDPGEMTQALNGGSGNPLRLLFKYGETEGLRRRLKKGISSEHQPETFSSAECRVLAAAQICLSRHPVKLLDDPVGHVARKKSAAKFLGVLVSAQSPSQLVVVALSRPVGLGCFDRVIELDRRGRVCFDGSAAQWESSKWVASVEDRPAAASPNESQNKHYDDDAA